jgi:flavin-dependent dehydrogenase
MSPSHCDFDVAIVGGGPSGLTLGLALAKHEIKVFFFSQLCRRGDRYMNC